MRSVALPVASVALDPRNPDWSPDSCAKAWDSFRDAMAASGAECARALNWMMLELARADREPLGVLADGKARLPPLPKEVGELTIHQHLYRGARSLVPDLDSQTVGTLKERALTKYRQARFDLRVAQKVSLPTYRAPAPVPVPGAKVTLTISEQRQPFVSLRVNGTRYLLRLRNGRERYRQVGVIERICAGELLSGEVTLQEQAAFGGRRNGSSVRSGPGANKRRTRYMVRIAVWMPRGRTAQVAGKVLVVRSTAEALFAVALESRETLWSLHEDHVRQMIAAHQGRLARMADDEKFERRRPRREKVNINDARSRLCEKHDRRMSDWLHKAAGMLAGLAKRQRVAVVRYDDTIREWCNPFPWFKLRELCRQKLDQAGIVFEYCGRPERPAVEEELDSPE